MNLLLNSGFDDSPGWAVWAHDADGAYLNDSGDARSLPNCAQLSCSRTLTNPTPPTYTVIEGWVWQEFTPRANQVYAIGCRVKSGAAWGSVVITVNAVEIARLTGDTGGGWSVLSGIWKAPDTSPAEVRIKALRGSGTGGGVWFVDDVGVAMARGGYITYAALMTALRQITTANGYNTDAGNRVYSKLVRPETGMKLPYICVIADPNQPPDEDRETYLMAHWRFRITAFVAGSESMAEGTSTMMAALDIRDDIRKAVRPYGVGGAQPLSSAGVSDVSPSSEGHDLLAGVPDGYAYGETTYPVDISVALTADNLGPGGV